jgi:aryl-alcohol dehydrogenase-like predicted oxidoreductase
MRYRQLGSSDLLVSEIALGSWLTYGGGIPNERAEACVARAVQVGINFFDTANVYAYGRAESFLGSVLAHRPRDSYILATKLFFAMPRTRLPRRIAGRIPSSLLRPDQGLSREQVFKQIDASLRRLRTDYVDLYQCHRYDWDTPLEETMAALSEVVRQGKARYIGFSEWPVEKIEQAPTLGAVETFVSSQPQYSMIWRAPEAQVIPFCREHGISQVVFSPLAQGILTGKYLPGEAPPPDSRAASDTMNWFMDRARDQSLLERVQRLRPVADDLGITMSQLALAWVLREPNVASVLTGASRPEQIEENAAASGITFDEGTLVRIDEILDGSIVRQGETAA